jgi:hypothetical protein
MFLSNRPILIVISGGHELKIIPKLRRSEKSDAGDERINSMRFRVSAFPLQFHHV